MTLGRLIAGALLAAEGWVLYHVLRQQGRLLLRIESLEDERAETEGGVWPARADAGPLSVPLSTLPARIQPQPPSSEEEFELTIGMATYNDFDGVYFTLQALRLYQDLEQTELLVIDNYGCDDTKNLVENWLHGRYIRATDAVGTAAPRDLIFREARGKAVLCCDCHVLFVPGALARLKQYYRDHPDCHDLLQGPLLFDDGKHLATHFEPRWQAQMWGTWDSDQRGKDLDGEPFEIPMQGLGVFSCLKTVWPGFHPEFRGFGGEEGYIHEKFRRAGGRCLCLPWLRWMHRFTRASGPKYPLTVEDKLCNYLLGHSELGLDLDPVLEHFSEYLPRTQVMALTERTLGRRWTGSWQTSHGVPSPCHDQKQAVLLEADQSQRNGQRATAVSRPPTGLKIGDAAPDFSLPDLSGTLVHLSSFRGGPTLLLFWRPSCDFCQRMLPDLKAWEAQPPEGAPRLLVVSSERVQDNQAMGLRSPVVLDEAGMSIGSQFGASGTPVAVLVDAEGSIASELAVGAPAVLALARRGLEEVTRTC